VPVRARVTVWARVPFEDAYTEVGGVTAPSLMEAYEQGRSYAREWGSGGLHGRVVYFLEEEGGPGWSSWRVPVGTLFEACTFGGDP
jgi:hypothetical protein